MSKQDKLQRIRTEVTWAFRRGKKLSTYLANIQAILDEPDEECICEYTGGASPEGLVPSRIDNPDCPIHKPKCELCGLTECDCREAVAQGRKDVADGKTYTLEESFEDKPKDPPKECDHDYNWPDGVLGNVCAKCGAGSKRDPKCKSCGAKTGSYCKSECYCRCHTTKCKCDCSEAVHNSGGCENCDCGRFREKKTCPHGLMEKECPTHSHPKQKPSCTCCPIHEK